MVPTRAARALLPIVVAGLLAAGPATALAAQPAPARPAPPPPAQLRLAPLAVSALSFIGSNLAAGVISKIGGDSFGAVLAQAGFADTATQTLNALKEVSVKLDRIEASVQQLHNEVIALSASVHNARLNAVRHSAAELVGRVDHAVALLRDLASGKYTDPTLRTEKRQELLDLIGTKIKDEQNFLNHVIYSPQGNDDIVRMAYRAERTGNRFFTDADGRAAARIFDYYQTIGQLILMLRVEYEYSTVKADSTETYLTEKRAAVKRLIDNQATARQPAYSALPQLLGSPDEVLDTKTRILWRAPHVGIYAPGQVHGWLPQNRLPTLGELRALVAGRAAGQTPPAFLRSHGWTIPTHCERDSRDYTQRNYPATESVFWTSDHSGSSRWAWAAHDDGQGLLGRACVMFNRHLAASERYYY
jgi:succinate dehydrogenase/fumarate reductase flavoprotein subunit